MGRRLRGGSAAGVVEGCVEVRPGRAVKAEASGLAGGLAGAGREDDSVGLVSNAWTDVGAGSCTCVCRAVNLLSPREPAPRRRAAP